MPKYLYKFVRVQVMNPDFDKTPEIGWVQEVPGQVGSYANNLGAQGWELVAASPFVPKPGTTTAAVTYTILIFKREQPTWKMASGAGASAAKKTGGKGRATKRS